MPEAKTVASLVAANLSPTDLSEILELEVAAFGTGQDAWSKTQWLEEFQAQDRMLLGLRAGDAEDKLVAVINFRKIFTEAELLRIIVSETHRGHGLGTQLCRQGLAALVENQITKVFLEVESGNLAALRLYHKLGFQEIAKRADYYGIGRDAVIMECGLEKADLGAEHG